MYEDVFLSETELPVEDSEEFPFYFIHVSFAKGSLLAGDNGGESPADSAERSIVSILGSNYESTKEHSFIGPVLRLDVEVFLCPRNVDKGDEENGHPHGSVVNEIPDETLEGGHSYAIWGSHTPRGECVAQDGIDCIDGGLCKVICKFACHFQPDELQDGLMMEGGV